MRTHEHQVLCGGARSQAEAVGIPLRLSLHGQSPNVTLRIQDISKRLVSNIPDALVDLLEVASYVYAADSAIGRGGKSDVKMGAKWRRTFRFVIQVRCPHIWGSTAVSTALTDLLTFLSDDNYSFEFGSLDERPEVQSYLEFSNEDVERFSPNEVVLFSGGLDSFAGAVEELANHGKSVALVSHRSATKIASAQLRLVDQLRQRFGAHRLLHIPVLANLQVGLGRETTHRTRSFLFAALGAVTARIFDIDRIRFFENGVVSLNLPPVAQVVGARATRTAHPQALAGFQGLLSTLFGSAFSVENPFVWRTKAEIVADISKNGFGHLIPDTRSCTRVHEMTTLHPHCGQCSQCLDRRFAVLAAGMAQDDPAEAYKLDLITGPRSPGPDREMALAYVRSASAIHRMEDIAFFARYGEFSRAVGYFEQPATKVAEHIFDLYRRHAASVCRIVKRAICDNADALLERSLPPDCLLSLLLGVGGVTDGTVYPLQHDQVGEWSQSAERATAASHEIRMAIDSDKGQVLFDRWGAVREANAKLLIVLARPHERATIDKRAPERYPFTKPQDLSKAVGVENDRALRKRVMRCRRAIEALATRAGETSPALDAVIENNQWHGYRLNPTSVRLLAPGELAQSR